MFVLARIPYGVVDGEGRSVHDWDRARDHDGLVLVFKNLAEAAAYKIAHRLRTYVPFQVSDL